MEKNVEVFINVEFVQKTFEKSLEISFKCHLDIGEKIKI